MNLQQHIRKVLKEELTFIFENENNLKESSFKIWDSVGFENVPSIEYFGLNHDDYREYVKEYLGEDYEDVVTNEIKKIVNEIKGCHGDEFSVKVNYIDYLGEEKYHVNLAVNFNSPVFEFIDFGDSEEVLTLFGQIEGCVEDTLNEIIYDKFGIYTQQVMINI